LSAHFAAVTDLSHSVVFAEAVLAVEGIVENDDLRGFVRIVLELREKERER
jgi:hypothetical protein